MIRPHLPPSWSGRLTAGLGVALVLMLSVLAASPELHAWVHGHQVVPAEHAGAGQPPVGDADHECAVTLFALGVTACLFFCLSLLRRSPDRVGRRPDHGRQPAARLRYWHVPAHAPPRG
jgi:hypothetical protein